MKRVLAAGFAAATLSNACAEAQVPAQPVDTLSSATECVEDYVDSTENAEQLPKLRERIDKAIEFGSVIQDQEVQEVVQFLRDSIDLLGETDSTDAILLQQGGQYECEPLQFFSSVPSFGVYSEDFDTLFLMQAPGEDASDLWGSLMTLHEARHAWSRNQEGPSEPFEEARARLFEQRIISQVGGEEYEDLLAQMEDKIIAAGFNEAGDYTINVVDVPAEQADNIFGKPVSDMDKRIRSTSIFLHAAFNVIQEEGQRQGFDEQQTLFALESIMSQFTQGAEQDAGSN